MGGYLQEHEAPQVNFKVSVNRCHTDGSQPSDIKYVKY